MNQEMLVIIDGHVLIKYIEEVITDAGLDFEKVCNRAGISDRDLCRYLESERWPSVMTIHKLNKAYQEELEYMKVG
jgi:transcriptional regulator with XRE-family HTH domain